MTDPAARFRVGLVGAGFISRHHIAALRSVPDVQIVGLHDLDEGRARAVGDEFGIATFGSLDALLRGGARVIHVLTPPHAHADVAVAALERGCDVLVEKPLAERPEDGARIVDAARAHGAMVSVDHSLLFDPQVERARARVRAGEIGQLVGMDLIRSAEFPPWEGGPLPPQYRSPGYPFRDQAVHALYLFEDFLGPIEQVEARWSSPRRTDPNLAIDEWMASVRCRDGFAGFRLSWNARPLQNQLVLHGTKGVLRVDLFLMFHGIRRSIPALPKAAERVLSAITDLAVPLVDVGRYSAAFARGRVVPYQGLHAMVGAFYASLREGTAPPVPVEDGARIARWVEHVAARADDAYRLEHPEPELAERIDVLVTGGTGNLGRAVTARLLAEGRSVRILSHRPSPDVPTGVEVVVGDLGNPDVVDRAVQGAALVVHAGAAMTGGDADHQRGTVLGTRNVVEACHRHEARLIHVSSLSVLDWVARASGVELSEASALEPHPERRGRYTQAKLTSEQTVAAAARSGRVRATILRPGQIHGGRAPLLTPATARRVAGRDVVLGDGRVSLPLVHVDDVADAVILVVERDDLDGQIFHLVGDEPLTQNEILAATRSDRDPTPVVHVPRLAVLALAWIAERCFSLLGRRSPLSVRQARAAMAHRRFDSSRARRVLGWAPRRGPVPVVDLDAIAAHEQSALASEAPDGRTRAGASAEAGGA